MTDTLSADDRSLLNRLTHPPLTGVEWRSASQLDTTVPVLRLLEAKGFVLSDCGHDQMPEPGTNIGWRLSEAGAEALADAPIHPGDSQAAAS